MEQRDSLDRSSSETPAPAAVAHHGAPFNGGGIGPASGQMQTFSYSATTANESSLVVDSVLKSDVRYYSCRASLESVLIYS